MQLTTKQARTFPLEFVGFPDGIDLRSAPEDIPITALAGAVNMEYDPLSGILRRVHGLTAIYDAEKSTDTGIIFNGNTIYASGATLYQVDTTTDIETSLGSLTGAYVPRFAPWGSDLLIASGGELQLLSSGLVLSTLTGSPSCNRVWIEDARVHVSNIGDDFVYLSGIGDATTWSTTPVPKEDWSGSDPSAGKYFEVGYKDGMDIIDVVKLSKDLIVFKAGPNSRKAYRVIGSYPDWFIVDASPDADCIHALAVENSALFIGWSGFKALDTVTDYSDVKSSEIGDKINAQLVQNIDNSAKLWHIPARKQIWLKGQNDQTVWVYHYNIRNPKTGSVGAFTRRLFKYTVNDVFINGIDVYVCYGNKIARIDDSVTTDDGDEIIGNFTPKRIVGSYDFVIEEATLSTSNMSAGTGLLQIGTKMMPLTFNASGDVLADDTDVLADDTDPLYETPYQKHEFRFTKRMESIEVQIYIYSGNAGFRYLSLKGAEV